MGERDPAQALLCTEPGRNGGVEGEADRSWGVAKRCRRTLRGFGAEIWEVAEAEDQVPPGDVIPVEEEGEEEEEEEEGKEEEEEEEKKEEEEENKKNKKRKRKKEEEEEEEEEEEKEEEEEEEDE